jgi:DNA-binding transcriptional LysR family regulator
MPEFRELRNLVAVAKHGHFGRAGRAEHLSQPALTKSIQRLEKKLGVKLLDRSRAKVRPTAVGQMVIRRAEAILSEVAELRREVDLLAGRETGEITVGVGPAMSETYVTRAIARLVQRRPAARIDVRVDHWSQLSEWLDEGRIDLYVADAAVTRGESHVHVIPTPPEELVWFCRSQHPLASAKNVTRKQLLQYPLVTPRMPEWASRWFAEGVDQGETRGIEHRINAVECENYTMLKHMVLAGNCVSAALRSTIQAELSHGLLVVLPVKAPILRTHAGIVYLRERTLSPLAEALIEEVLKAASEITEEPS